MRILFFVCALAASQLGYGQTGQALIANPLLSPEKLKEVKRQIMEAGHQELAQPKLSMPVAPPPQGLVIPGGPGGNAGMVPGMMPGMPVSPSGPPPFEEARRAFVQLRVTAIVGTMALIATELPQPQMNPMSATTGAQRMGMGPSLQNPQIMQNQQMQNPPAQNHGAQASQNFQQMRRAGATTVRHGVPTYIDGYEVMPWVQGDVVRLALAAMPSETVFQGSVQPALYSPSGMANLEMSSSEYLNSNKPEATSMGQQSAVTVPSQTQFPVQNNSSFPNSQR